MQVGPCLYADIVCVAVEEPPQFAQKSSQQIDESSSFSVSPQQKAGNDHNQPATRNPESLRSDNPPKLRHSKSKA